MRISPLAATPQSFQGAMRSSGQREAMNSAMENPSSRVKPKWLLRGSELSQGRSMMCMRKHQSVTQHEHGVHRWCPTAPPGFLDDDTCCRDEILGDNHRDWLPGGIPGGTGSTAPAEYCSISGAYTICSRRASQPDEVHQGTPQDDAAVGRLPGQAQGRRYGDPASWANCVTEVPKRMMLTRGAGSYPWPEPR